MEIIIETIILILILCIFIFRKYLFSYSNEKGKNLATKEDIEEITNKIESVKSSYATVLEEIRSKNQIKISSIEREKLIKKEVYIDSIEAMDKLIHSLSNFPNLNIDTEALTKELTILSGKVAKVHIVGSEQAVKAISTFMSLINEAYLKLILTRTPLIERKNSIEIYDGLRKKCQDEVEEYILLMKRLNLEANTNENIWSTINNNIDFQNNQINKYDKKIDSLYKVQNEELLEYLKECMSINYEISMFIPNVVLPIRNELELDIDADEYININNQNIEKAKDIFNSFLSKTKNEFSN